jgi:hypothetical protein
MNSIQIYKYYEGQDKEHPIMAMVMPKRYTAIATPTKGANAINGIPNTPFNLVSTTTEPVANTTTINVPITLATNFF